MADMSDFKYSQLKINSPCYDPKTKKDCPNRGKGCHANCSLWAEYEKHREAERKKNVRNSSDESTYTSYCTDRAKRIKKAAKYRKK